MTNYWATDWVAPQTTSTWEEVKDSGKRQEFDTGARRDTQDGKPRYDLIPLSPLTRLAMHYTNGAVKYGESNWTKGMPLSRFYASLFRHLISWARGDRAEDHMAAVAWNAFAIMHFEDKGGFSPSGEQLNDMAVHRGDEVPE
jgi:hypothetical protein